MGLWGKATALWQAASQQYVHGWVQSDAPVDTVEPGEGKHYLQVRLTGMSLRFSREHFADRSPVLQSAIRWPVGGERITVSQTVDRSRFTQPATTEDAADFMIYQVSDLALSGDLPLNSGDVEVNVALLAAPGSSLLDHATSFLNDIADLTLVPQLSVAAPVASKIAGGVDQLLGNDEVAGVLAFCTSVPADDPQPGFFLVTDLPTESGQDLSRLAVKDRTLWHWLDKEGAWRPAAGFSYLLLEFRVEGSKPTRWTELPEITDLSQAALQRLAQATTDADVADAAPQMRLAAMKALYSPDLAHINRDPAAQALVDQWKQQVARLADLRTSRPTGAGPIEGMASAPAPAVVSAAERVRRELDDIVSGIRVGEVDVTARDVAGTAKGIVAPRGAPVAVGAVRVDAQGVSGTVIGVEVT